MRKRILLYTLSLFLALFGLWQIKLIVFADNRVLLLNQAAHQTLKDKLRMTGSFVALQVNTCYTFYDKQ